MSVLTSHLAPMFFRLQYVRVPKENLCLCSCWYSFLFHWHANLWQCASLLFLQTTHPRSGETTHDWQLLLCNEVMIDSNAWIEVHQFLLHRLYIEHRMMFHVATTQLVFLRILLLTWHKVRTLGHLFTLNHILLSSVTKLSKSYTKFQTRLFKDVSAWAVFHKGFISHVVDLFTCLMLAGCQTSATTYPTSLITNTHKQCNDVFFGNSFRDKLASHFFAQTCHQNSIVLC